MSGSRRLIVGDITLNTSLRGKGLSDELYAQLNSQEAEASAVKKTVDGTVKKTKTSYDKRPK